MTLLKLGAFALALGLAACSSSVKNSSIASTANPSEEIARVENEINEGYAAHFDILANEEFSQSQKYLKEAKDDLAGNQGQKEVLEDLRNAQSHLNKAKEKAGSRSQQVGGIIEARQKALTAGARDFPPTRESLSKIDEVVRSNSANFAKINADRFSTIQSQYLDVELAAIKNTQLGKAQAEVTGAKKARSYAPKSLKRAEMDLKNAENTINSNRNSPDTYAEAVQKANYSSRLLGAVLAATQNGKVDENTAMNLVAQQRKISNLEGELDQANSESSQKSVALAEQGQELKDNARIIELQKSIEAARKEFTKEEADVFQQGDKLLIRLKSMKFASGGADLPGESMAVLAKVKSVADELNSKSVRVEGHTDSTGGKEINQQISQQRAVAVAKYLNTSGIEQSSIQAVGYGFSKPIAPNKSSAGRLQNRRVDVVITPGMPSGSTVR